MKEYVSEKLLQVVNEFKNQQVIPEDLIPHFTVERTKDKNHGDFATNLALTLAKPAKANPRQIA